MKRTLFTDFSDQFGLFQQVGDPPPPVLEWEPEGLPVRENACIETDGSITYGGGPDYCTRRGGEYHTNPGTSSAAVEDAGVIEDAGAVEDAGVVDASAGAVVDPVDASAGAVTEPSITEPVLEGSGSPLGPGDSGYSTAPPPSIWEGVPEFSASQSTPSGPDGSPVHEFETLAERPRQHINPSGVEKFKPRQSLDVSGSQKSPKYDLEWDDAPEGLTEAVDMSGHVTTTGVRTIHFDYQDGVDSGDVTDQDAHRWTRGFLLGSIRTDDWADSRRDLFCVSEESKDREITDALTEIDTLAHNPQSNNPFVTNNPLGAVDTVLGQTVNPAQLRQIRGLMQDLADRGLYGDPRSNDPTLWNHLRDLRTGDTTPEKFIETATARRDAFDEEQESKAAGTGADPRTTRQHMKTNVNDGPAVDRKFQTEQGAAEAANITAREEFDAIPTRGLEIIGDLTPDQVDQALRDPASLPEGHALKDLSSEDRIAVERAHMLYVDDSIDAREAELTALDTERDELREARRLSETFGDGEADLLDEASLWDERVSQVGETAAFAADNAAIRRDIQVLDQWLLDNPTASDEARATQQDKRDEYAATLLERRGLSDTDPLPDSAELEADQEEAEERLQIVQEQRASFIADHQRFFERRQALETALGKFDPQTREDLGIDLTDPATLVVGREQYRTVLDGIADRRKVTEASIADLNATYSRLDQSSDYTADLIAITREAFLLEANREDYNRGAAEANLRLLKSATGNPELTLTTAGQAVWDAKSPSGKILTEAGKVTSITDVANDLFGKIMGVKNAFDKDKKQPAGPSSSERPDNTTERGKTFDRIADIYGERGQMREFAKKLLEMIKTIDERRNQRADGKSFMSSTATALDDVAGKARVSQYEGEKAEDDATIAEYKAAKFGRRYYG